jgi:Flp pilus assembly protein TadD
MSVSLLLASALLASPEAHVVAAPAGADHVEVAYVALSEGRNDAAVAQLRASHLAANGDPAALINLGSAYARMGRTEEALVAFRSAIASDVRYDLQLADGSWMDSRRAARIAAAQLDKGSTLAAR